MSDDSMKQLEFTGRDDDTLVCRGLGISLHDEDCGTCTIAICSAAQRHMRVASALTGESLVVSGQYDCTPGGPTWSIGVAVDNPRDKVPPINMPDWQIAFEPGTLGYSPVLIITAPDDATVELLK